MRNFASVAMDPLISPTLYHCYEVDEAERDWLSPGQRGDLGTPRLEMFYRLSQWRRGKCSCLAMGPEIAAFGKTTDWICSLSTSQRAVNNSRK